MPLLIHEEGMDEAICRLPGIKAPEADMREWQKMADRLRNSSDNVTIGIVGKYVELQDASLSIMEALRHGGVVNGLSVQIRWIGEENAVSSGASQQARQTASAFREFIQHTYAAGSVSDGD